MHSWFRALVWFYLATFSLCLQTQALGFSYNRKAAAKDPWSLYVTGAKGGGYYPSVCHELKFFSGSPLRFDYEQDFFAWPPDSFTYTTKVSLIGTVQKHRIYQVTQNTHHEPGKPPKFAWGDVVMRRILIERDPNKYCLIYQETNSYGILDRIDPANLDRIDGDPVLYVHDPVRGNGGYYSDAAWTFDGGVPVRLRFEGLIDQTFKEVAPQGCRLPTTGDPLNLEKLTYHADLVPNVKSALGGYYPSCGSLDIRFGFRNHKLVIVHKQYSPNE